MLRISELLNAAIEEERQKDTSREEFLDKELDLFIARLNENNSNLEEKLKRITAEYLVLRHNSRVAIEKLLQDYLKIT